EGPVELLLGKSGLKVEGKVNRSANQNGTARIMGGAKLRDWFQANFEPGDSIDVDLGSLDSIRVGPTVVANLDESDETSSKKLEKTTSPDREVTPDDLTRWHRYLLRLLDALDERPALQEGVPSRINRLSRNGKVPREIA